MDDSYIFMLYDDYFGIERWRFPILDDPLIFYAIMANPDTDPRVF